MYWDNKYFYTYQFLNDGQRIRPGTLRSFWINLKNVIDVLAVPTTNVNNVYMIDISEP